MESIHTPSKQTNKKWHLMSVFWSFFILCTWGVSPDRVSATCTYSGALSWSGGCGATVNETLADGASKNVINTNANVEGVASYRCSGTTFVQTGAWCQNAPEGSCKIGAGGGFGGANWTVLDDFSQPVSCGNMSLGQTPSYRILNGTSLTVTNILPGVTGAITYSCTNGQLIAQGSGTCTVGGGGGSTPDPGGGGGGGSTPTPTPDPGGGGSTPPVCIPNGICSSANTCFDTLCTTNCGQPVIGTKICGPTITSFAVDKTTLATKGPVTLKWTTEGGITSCNASGGWSGNITPVTNGTATQHVSQATIFYLECFDAAGTSSGKKAVQVTFGPTITSFTADKATLSAPGSVVLNWATTSTTTCTASGGWNGNITPVSGGTSTQNIDKTTTFYLECKNAAGVSSGEREVKVSVNNGSCTPNDTCAQDLCAGTTCNDGCGGNINGQKNCSIAPCTNPDNSCATEKCTYDTCFNTCGDEIQGTKACIPLTSATGCASGAACKASCDKTIENEGARCNNNTGYCCEPIIAPVTPPVSTTPFSNPVAFNTVEGLLDSILGFLQASIVILSLIMIVIGSLVYMTAGGEESKLKSGKYIITASLVGLALALAAPTFLKEVGNILGWNGVNSGTVTQSKTLLEILTTALNFLLSIVGIIAIIMLVIGGLMYLTSAGDEDRMKQGKSIVVYSLIGVTVALSALVLVTMVVGWFS